MINLLPSAEKQKLFLEKKEKLAIVLGIVVSVSLICLTLILLSIKFYILIDTDYQRNILEQTEQSVQTPDFKNFNNIIQKYNTTLAQLDSFYKKEIYFNQVLKTIIEVPSPKNLYITNFLINRDKTGKVNVSLYGVSDTRDNLLIFKNNLEQDKNIHNSVFSPESWINPKNANFSLTFEINSNETY